MAKSQLSKRRTTEWMIWGALKFKSFKNLVIIEKMKYNICMIIAFNTLYLLLYKKYWIHLIEICTKGRLGRPYLLGLYARSFSLICYDSLNKKSIDRVTKNC